MNTLFRITLILRIQLRATVESVKNLLGSTGAKPSSRITPASTPATNADLNSFLICTPLTPVPNPKSPSAPCVTGSGLEKGTGFRLVIALGLANCRNRQYELNPSELFRGCVSSAPVDLVAFVIEHDDLISFQSGDKLAVALCAGPDRYGLNPLIA